LIMGKWCPFIKGPCNNECVFYRKGMRYFTAEVKKEPLPFEDCAFNIITDSVENLIMRNIGQQAAIEGMRNKIDELTNFFRGAFTFSLQKDKKLTQ
jgi:hypothetical protein